jgi:hypothetical protein
MHATKADPNPRGWFVVAAAAALVVALAIASSVGGITGLLAVGEEFPIRDYVLADLPDVELATGVGHDGQQYYGIARDPLGRGEVPDLLDNPSYRYLFILYPALAGGFGTFSPELTVAAMLALSVVGFGLAGASALMLNHQLGGRATVAFVAVANAGLLLAVRFLLPDPLALGLAMLGVTLAVAGKDRPAAVALTLAVLTKTPYFLFPLALGAWVWPTERRRAWWLTFAPAAPAALWLAYVFIRFGPSTAGNLTAPFAGFVTAIGQWSDVSTGEMVLALLAAALVVTGAVLAAITRHPLLRLLLVAWVGLGLISSELIWKFGNNAMRVMAPLWTVAALAAALYLSSSRSRRNLPV